MMVGYLINETMVIHFGKNPSNGGIPLSDKRRNEIMRDVCMMFVLDLLMLVNKKFIYIIINSGMVIIEYIMRYMIDIAGLFGTINLDIQPMWVMDENAIMVLSFV
jgi:hypothetical protein